MCAAFFWGHYALVAYSTHAHVSYNRNDMYFNGADKIEPTTELSLGFAKTKPD